MKYAVYDKQMRHPFIVLMLLALFFGIGLWLGCWFVINYLIEGMR